jgi:hypothetical protein
VQRAADHDPGDALEVAQRREIIERLDHPAGDHRRPQPARHVGHQREAGIGHVRVVIDIRHDDTAQVQPVEALREGQRRDVGRPGPAVRHDVAGADIDRQHDPERVARTGLAHQPRPEIRGRADDHAIRAMLHPPIDLVDLADTAADLHGHRHAVDQRHDQVRVAGLARPRAHRVEIHHVEPFGPFGDELLCLDDGIVVVDHRLAHLAAAQDHASAVLNADIGVDYHRRILP